MAAVDTKRSGVDGKGVGKDDGGSVVVVVVTAGVTKPRQCDRVHVFTATPALPASRPAAWLAPCVGVAGWAEPAWCSEERTPVSSCDQALASWSTSPRTAAGALALIVESFSLVFVSLFELQDESVVEGLDPEELAVSSAAIVGTAAVQKAAAVADPLWCEEGCDVLQPPSVSDTIATDATIYVQADTPLWCTCLCTRRSRYRRRISLPLWLIISNWHSLLQ